MAGRRAAVAANPDSSDRSCFFPITAAILSCLYNLLIAVSAAYYLPDDPLFIGLSISLYAWAGTILSICGLAGIILSRPTLITSFSHFLLIDTFLSATTRLLILSFFLESFSSESELCTPGAAHNHRQQIPSSQLWNPSNFRHEIVTSVRWQKEHIWSGTGSGNRRCELALNAVQIFLIGALIAITAAQGAMAVSIRRFGREMEVEQRVGQGEMVRRGRARGTEKARRSPQPSDPEKEAL